MPQMGKPLRKGLKEWSRPREISAVAGALLGFTGDNWSEWRVWKVVVPERCEGASVVGAALSNSLSRRVYLKF